MDLKWLGAAGDVLKRIAAPLILLGVSVALLEVGARGAVAWLERSSRFEFPTLAERWEEWEAKTRELLDAQGRSLVQLDATLGWIYAADYRGALYTSNSAGHRGVREYSARPGAGVLRLAAFGDSFVHGNEVADDEVWSARLEALDPRVEVLNYGVGGFGIDQALLYYRRRGRAFAPHVVLLGFADVDYRRNVNRFRRFISDHELPLFKPRFRLRDGALELIPNPFPGPAALEALLEQPDRLWEAAEHDAFYEPWVWQNPLYDHSALVRLASTLGSRAWRSRLSPQRLMRGGVMNERSEGFPLLVALVTQLAREVQAAGQQFQLVIFPGQDGDIWGDGPRSHGPLLRALHGIDVLDLAETLGGDCGVTPATLRQPKGHYSPAANACVARALHARLISRGLLSPGAG